VTESGNDVNICCRRRCGRKKKTTSSDDEMIIRNSVKAPWNTSRGLQSDLTVSGVILDPSTVRKRLLTAGRLARKPSKKQLLTTAIMKNRLQQAKNVDWGAEQRKRVIFPNESHFEVHGYLSWYIRSIGETIGKTHSSSHNISSQKDVLKIFFCFGTWQTDPNQRHDELG